MLYKVHSGIRQGCGANASKFCTSRLCTVGMSLVTFYPCVGVVGTHNDLARGKSSPHHFNQHKKMRPGKPRYVLCIFSLFVSCPCPLIVVSFYFLACNNCWCLPSVRKHTLGSIQVCRDKTYIGYAQSHTVQKSDHSHLNVWSQDPDTQVKPSELSVAHFTNSVCPFSVAVHSLVTRSHTLQGTRSMMRLKHHHIDSCFIVSGLVNVFPHERKHAKHGQSRNCCLYACQQMFPLLPLHLMVQPCLKLVPE
jgi:hypothetical protein